MRILHVITSLDRGGAEAHLRDLVERQAEAGHTVACAWLKGQGHWVPTLQSLGVAVHPLDLKAYGDPRPVWRLRRLARELQPDVVHAHLQPAELYAATALGPRRPGRVPLVFSRHNLGRFHKGPAPDALERWTVARADRLIAISNAVAERLARINPAYPADRIEVIPYGVDLRPYAPEPETHPAPARARLRAEWNIPETAFAFGTVSRLIPTKRADILIDALALVRAEHPDKDPRLIVAGEGPVLAALKARATERGVADAVTFAGFRTDIPQVMSAFDAFAFASVTEGFGLVLLEAMAARLPVITTGIRPMSDIVADGVTGLHTAVADAASTAAAMGRVLGDAGLARRLAVAGRLAAEVYGLGVMAGRVEGVYRAAGV